MNGCQVPVPHAEKPTSCGPFLTPQERCGLGWVQRRAVSYRGRSAGGQQRLQPGTLQWGLVGEVWRRAGGGMRSLRFGRAAVGALQGWHCGCYHDGQGSGPLAGPLSGLPFCPGVSCLKWERSTSPGQEQVASVARWPRWTWWSVCCSRGT